MSDSPFEGKADFNNESFYYFLPKFNFEQKQKIGEKITKFKGVIYSYLFNYKYLIIYIFNFLQLISFSLKENINILISSQTDLNTPKFRDEILSFGNVKYYSEEKPSIIKCINKSLSNPENYKCFLLDFFWKIVQKFDESDEIITYFKKKGLKENINLPSSIIYQLPSYNIKLFNYCEFPKIEEAALVKKSVTEYDIPQYIPDMPPGFSIFCTLGEAVKVRQYMSLNEEEKNIVIGMQQKEEENENNILDEPVPKTKFCHWCMRKFDDYLIHIETLTHKNNISKNPLLINRTKNTFERINKFWNKERNENYNDTENNNTQNKKEEKYSHNKISSFSSFSSSASTLKNDESVSFLKSINSFLLEQELIESEKNKENINENSLKKTKERNIFNTPKKKSDCKYSSYFSSSQSNFNCYINKKRKLHLDEEKKEKNEDYFNDLNTKKTKRLIRGKDVFFK